MDNWNYRVRRRNPSFSSSLLDEIYRSIDQTPTPDDPKKVDQNVETLLLHNSRKKSEYYDNDIEAYYLQSFRFNSCSSSSDSGSGGSFWTSSSESATSKTSAGKSKLAIRTSFSSQIINHQTQQQEDEKIYISHRKLKNECGGFVKAKSKSLKTHGDLKKPKANQPISPGSRLASFLNSLFTSPGTAKKSKIQQEESERKCNSASTCSSASSISRSRFSKTSSREKPTDGAKRSVRFSPLMSVIVDEDYQNRNDERRSHNNIPTTAARNSICSGEEIRGNNRRAREVLRNYSRKLNECLKMDDDDEEDGDDCSSCGSSDLFELDNLDCVIGRERYCEELPVYETTSVNANRAIANGLIMQ